jgi:hypothetical protein
VKRLVGLVTVMAVLGLVAVLGVNAAATTDRTPSLRELLRSAPSAVKVDRDHDRRLVVVERNAVETDIDNPPEGFSVGDEVIIASALVQKGKRIGRLDGHVVFTHLNASETRLRALVNVTASLRKGEIEAQGVVVFMDETAEFDFGVTGGTGRYDDVGGEAHIVEDGDVVRYVFDLEDLD